MFSVSVLVFPTVAAQPRNSSPLALYSKLWNKPAYSTCNTASGVMYLSPKEKEIIYIINLVRGYPKVFAETVLNFYPQKERERLQYASYFKSLADTLNNISPLNILYPDSLVWVSAHCHAQASGETSYTGHERRNKKCDKLKYFFGECCTADIQLVTSST